MKQNFYSQAFTMIEVIFVIVIIGILASVAIPRLAASRNDAEATVCVHEVGQLLHEISNEYTKVGYSNFKTEVISDMSNIKIISVSDHRGIKLDLQVDTTGITYVCDDEDIVTVRGVSTSGDYNLTVVVLPGTSPIAQTASENIIKKVIGGISPKVFSL